MSNTTVAAKLDMKLEVVVIPVSDTERAQTNDLRGAKVFMYTWDRWQRLLTPN